MVSVDTLVSYAEELEDVTVGSGIAWLKNRRDEALARMQGGGSREYTSTIVDGQRFDVSVTASAHDWWEALQAAIDIMLGNRVKITYARNPCPLH